MRRRSYGFGLALLMSIGCGDDGSGTTPTSSSSSSSSGTSTGSTGGSDPTPGSMSMSGSSESSTGGDDPTTSGGGSTEGGTDPSGGSGSTTGAAAGPTWENFAMSFFETYCWECHGAGDEQGRDYSTLAGVLAESNSIRCGTAPAASAPRGCEGEPPAGQFPVGATIPSDEDRTTLVEWIEAGLPEN